MTDLLPTDPGRWGPSAWDFLYCVAFSYPHKPTDQEKKDMLEFLISLKNILPCYNCRRNYRKRIKRISIKRNLCSKKELVLWIMNMKNEIAIRNNKRLDTYYKLCKKYHLDKLQF